MTNPDPAALLFQLFNQFGQMGATPGGAGTGSSGPGGAMGRQMIERALAAANMPTRTELDELSARVGRIEAALFRIEGLLREGHQSPAAPPAPSPTPTPDTDA